MLFQVTVLGSNSAAPAFGRHQTSQLLQIDDHFILIDCGDGTQLQVQRYGIRLNRINYIFISHLHGDHYFGLIGLISSMHLHGRKKELHLYGPPGLAEIITVQLKYSETVLNYRLHFHEITTTEPQTIMENHKISVTTFPLDHRVPCYGYYFREQPKRRRIIKEKIGDNFPIPYINQLKDGENIHHEDGSVRYHYEDYTLPPRRSRSFAYFSDTRYSERFVSLVKNADLLYHESTFTSEHQERAEITFHSTARQAASFARKAEVGRLILGHYSTRYRDLDPILEEAKAEFANSELGIEGQTYTVSD